jgi:hypothetical protein
LIFNILTHLVEISPLDISADYFQLDPLENNILNVEHMIANTLKLILSEYPSLSRHWAKTQLDSKTQSDLSSFISLKASKYIKDREISAVRKQKQRALDEGMLIKTVGSDIICGYNPNDDEDCHLELSLQMPDDYPLSPVKVNLNSSAGITKKRERTWQLKLSMFMNNPSFTGTIIEGLLKWKQLVDNEFEGVETCAICYSIVYAGSDAQSGVKALPKIYCKQCKHKFHQRCIYKWFQSSNNNTCPLCRTPMIF